MSMGNNSTKDIEEMESSSGIQDESPSKMEASREASNISARSDQTTLEFHDAQTPEDMVDDVVTVSAKPEPFINKDLLPSEVDNLAAAEIQHVSEVQELQGKGVCSKCVLCVWFQPSLCCFPCIHTEISDQVFLFSDCIRW